MTILPSGLGCVMKIPKRRHKGKVRDGVKLIYRLIAYPVQGFCEGCVAGGDDIGDFRSNPKSRPYPANPVRRLRVQN